MYLALYEDKKIINMVNYGSIWSTSDIFCQKCHKNTRGLQLKSIEMAKHGLSLDLCSSCLSEIVDSSSSFV